MNGGVVMSSNIMLIGLDNGNKCTKNHVGFVCESGFTKSDVEPITKSNLLVYKGDFYTIGSIRLSCLRRRKMSVS